MNVTEEAAKAGRKGHMIIHKMRMGDVARVKGWYQTDKVTGRQRSAMRRALLSAWRALAGRPFTGEQAYSAWCAGLRRGCWRHTGNIEMEQPPTPAAWGNLSDRERAAWEAVADTACR